MTERQELERVRGELSRMAAGAGSMVGEETKYRSLREIVELSCGVVLRRLESIDQRVPSSQDVRYATQMFREASRIALGFSKLDLEREKWAFERKRLEGGKGPADPLEYLRVIAEAKSKIPDAVWEELERKLRDAREGVPVELTE